MTRQQPNDQVSNSIIDVKGSFDVPDQVPSVLSADVDYDGNKDRLKLPGSTSGCVTMQGKIEDKSPKTKGRSKSHIKSGEK